MKVYVIKNKEGMYKTDDCGFITSICFAELFDNYRIAKDFCPYNCEVVECDLMETTALSDYTKQVRKEVVQEIKKLMQEKKGAMIGRYNYQTAQHDEVEVFELGDLNKVLNKIIGE